MSSVKYDFPTRAAVYPSVLERVVEIEFALSHVRRGIGRRVLDVGVGEFPALWYTLTQCGFDVTGTDVITDYFKKVPADLSSRLRFDDITRTRFSPNSFDAITCVSTLEHIPDWEAAAMNMSCLCRVGGRVVVTIPFSKTSPCDNIKTRGKLTRIFSPEQITRLGERIGTLTEEVSWRCWTGKRWRDGERLAFPVNDTAAPDLICLSYQVTQ